MCVRSQGYAVVVNDDTAVTCVNLFAIWEKSRSSVVSSIDKMDSARMIPGGSDTGCVVLDPKIPARNWNFGPKVGDPAFKEDFKMLVLSRKDGEQIRIGDTITLTVVSVRGKRVKIGIEAPKNCRIVREEVQPKVPDLSDSQCEFALV